MKDFCKWLGVNEKIAKLVVWLFVVMFFIIIGNIMLESVGLPYYKLTVDNLSKVNYSKVFDYVLSWILVLLNFYSMIFLVFRIKDFNKVFKWSILYLVLNVLITIVFGTMVAQIFILIYCLLFCFIYSKNNSKYILYGFGSYLFNAFIQFLCYLYKIRFIDYTKLNLFNRFLTSLDYFIILFVIILVKEIMIKRKRGEINGN